MNNIVDSSGWLEYFSGGPFANRYKKPLSELEKLIVPEICIYEVFKVVLREKDESAALQAFALMQQGRIITLNSQISFRAAKISLEHQLPMAASIVFSTGLLFDAVIWTQDKNLKTLPKVKFFGEPSQST